MDLHLRGGVGVVCIGSEWWAACCVSCDGSCSDLDE